MKLPPLSIGPHRLASPLVAAPMAGVTDRVFRQLCRRLGAGMAVSEMPTADDSLWHTRKSRLRMDHAGETGPVSVQIAGADPAQLARAARLNVDHGADLIDINMGCPAKKVCNVMAGSALLEDEALVGRILDAVVAAVDVPVTLKIRTGPDPARRNGLRIARMAEAAGIQCLAVHGRTRAERYQGSAEYRTIAEIKGSVSIPVVANGDIDSPEKALSVLRETAADGLMIGRSSQGNPWIFKEIEHFLENGSRRPAPSATEVGGIMLEHLAALHEFYGAEQGSRVARKHIGWYLATRPNGEAMRRRLMKVTCASEQLQMVQAYFEDPELAIAA